MSTDEPQTTRASDTSSLLKYLALGEKLVTKFFIVFINILFVDYTNITSPELDYWLS